MGIDPAYRFDFFFGEQFFPAQELNTAVHQIGTAAETIFRRNVEPPVFLQDRFVAEDIVFPGRETGDLAGTRPGGHQSDQLRTGAGQSE